MIISNFPLSFECVQDENNEQARKISQEKLVVSRDSQRSFTSPAVKPFPSI